MRPGVVVLLTTMLFAARADAQTDERAARAHFSSGRAYYDQGRYEDALREFTEAFRVAPDASKGLMVFNMGQGQERLGRLAEAIASFQRYLELVPDAEDRATIEERIRGLQERLAQTGIVLTVSEPGARVLVDGTEAGTTPLAAALQVTPGSHELRVEKEGFQPFRLRVAVEAGRRVEAEATLVALQSHTPPPPPPRPADPAPSRGRTWTWVTAGVTGLALAGGTVLGFLALGESDSANAEVAGDADRYDEHLSSAENLALFADISFGVGILAAASTVVLFIVEGGSGESEAAPQHAALFAAPVATRDGAHLVLSGSF